MSGRCGDLPGRALSTLSTVKVGGFDVADVDRPTLLNWVLENRPGENESALIALAVHVGSLSARNDPGYASVVNMGSAVYADGASVVLGAKLAGAKFIQRYPTTDFGVDLCRALKARLGRPPRVALIGGPAGLAQRAGSALARNGVDVVATIDGYSASFTDSIGAAARRGPEILFLGLGAPREHHVAIQAAPVLNGCIVVTCGGWFGFLAGHERRAPMWAQNAGLEWAFRLAQSPRRLVRRYMIGALATVQVAGAAAWTRLLSLAAKQRER